MHGSDGAAFNPYIKKGETLWFFNDQLCRAMPLVYAQTVQHKGLPGLRCGIPTNHHHWYHCCHYCVHIDAQYFAQIPAKRRCLHVVQKLLPVSFFPTFPKKQKFGKFGTLPFHRRFPFKGRMLAVRNISSSKEGIVHYQRNFLVWRKYVKDLDVRFAKLSLAENLFLHN